ncbi:hypothetical protein ACFWIQ_32085 [Kitasatospora sp. NPDC127059]|uniref:hypothetical protein n=1 Tax=unclassified Kitasatospora TaxID=2633591 RepID=UPI00365253FA
MASPIPGRRRAAGLAGFAGLVLTVGLALTGCDPSAADGKATASPTAAASATPTVAVSSAPSSPVAPPPVAPTQSALPSAAPPSAPTTGHPQTSTAKPQPKVTTAQPPTDPEPQHTQAAAGGSGCEIRSNAGNCYAAGQFCRDADLGRSTHDAGGRMIYCRMVSGKPHWQA